MNTQTQQRATFPVILITITTSLLAACGGGRVEGGAELRPSSRNALHAEVRRTDYGIVHVKAEDYAGIGYGYAFALAEDHLCRVADNYVTVSGERSKYFGPEGTWLFSANTTVNNNLDSDFFFNLLIAEQRVEKLLALAPPNGPSENARELVRGYVAGYNQYLRETGKDNLPDPTCRGAEWVREITELDVYRHFYKLAMMASSGVAIEGIGSAQPPLPSLLPVKSASLDPEEIARQIGTAWKGLKLGSNAIALGGDATDTGRGMLLGNPHFPWYGHERFYRIHVTIPGELDATGVSLIGVPMVLVGYNKDVAWTHTVSSAWRFTPYHLNLVPGNPTSYLVDGQPEAMTPWNLSVQALQADGSLAPVERTLYTTRWGPVMNSLLGLPVFPWLPTEAYALADANALNFNMINHFMEGGRSTSVRELHEVLKRNQGVPWVNTIAADRHGEAFYADITVVPNVSDAKALECTSVLGVATGPLLGLPVLDGSRSDCAWGTDSDAVQAGRIGPGQMPNIYRRDYVTNSNDSHWLSSPNQPLEGFARIIGDERTERRMRTRSGLVMVEERLSGSDGLPGKTFSRQQLQDLMLNNRSHAAELWLDDLVALCRLVPVMVGSAGPVMTGEACDVLEAWDRTNNLDSPGALLFARFMANAYLAGVPTGTAAFGLEYVDMWAQPFDVNDPVHTPSGLNVLNPHVQVALADAIADVTGAGFTLDATLRESQFVTRGNEIIPIPGGHGASGVFNDIQATWDPERGYSDIPFGASYIQVVSFDGDDCPDARTILSYSQSSNPHSPHFVDQTRLFSEGGWVDAQFCEEDIVGRVTSTRRVSQ